MGSDEKSLGHVGARPQTRIAVKRAPSNRDPGPMYFERQRYLHCLRHALNHLLQGPVVTRAMMETARRDLHNGFAAKEWSVEGLTHNKYGNWSFNVAHRVMQNMGKRLEKIKGRRVGKIVKRMALRNRIILLLIRPVSNKSMLHAIAIRDMHIYDSACDLQKPLPFDMSVFQSLCARIHSAYVVS
eukprot:m.219571 g.219571  ORF g.219571 m.219571 type:complete len:185 (+) comp17002_c0_seq5:222-776(+)